LLLIASESGNAETIGGLLQYGIKTQIKLPAGKVTAQGLAWKRRDSYVLLKLLQADLPFPQKIDINECSDELKRFIETSQEFHKMIKEQNKDRINEILSSNHNLKYFYDLTNNSASIVALKLKLFDIYELLISRNLSFGPHEDIDIIYKSFLPYEKERVRYIHIKNSKSIGKNHIDILMSNTEVSHDEPDKNGKMKLIQNAYNALTSDHRLEIILKIVAATKEFRIIFYFKRESIYEVDPTTSNGTSGIIYPEGYILNMKDTTVEYETFETIIVAAKKLLNPNTEHIALGTLAHELCHYAIGVVYRNNKNPYKANDERAKREFDRIIKSSAKNQKTEYLIQNVYKSYDKEDYPAELIVRPAQIIAFYRNKPEIIQKLKITFYELFDYYLNDVVPAMQRVLPEIESKFVCKPTHTYVQLLDQSKKEVQNAVVKYKNVEIKFVELFPGNSDIFEDLTSDHISQMLGYEDLNFDDPQFRYLEEQIEFKWENLPGNLKEKFLDSDLDFQGQIVKFKSLNDLYPDAFDALTSQQIINVLSGKEIKIVNKFESKFKFYVERKFIPEDAKLITFEYYYGHEYVLNYATIAEHVKNRIIGKSFQEFSNEVFKKDFDKISQLFQKVKENSVFKLYLFNPNGGDCIFMHKNSIEIIEQGEKEKILILSSEAGAGKTVTFEKLTMEIKSKFPTRWVSYLDLPKYTELYKSSGTAENLLKDILGLNSEKNNFEVKIFEESLKSGNLVLIWNAFDELSPSYSDFILNLLKSIHETSSNVQFVCTRPLYSDKLSKTFKVRNWQLVPFVEDNKHEFLREFFISENISSAKIHSNIKKVEKIVKKLYFENKFNYNFETPLMLKLIAEIHENENLFKPANIYGIYKAFIEKKIEIWLKKSKNTFSIAKKLLLSGSLTTILQKYALLNEFGSFSISTLGLKMRKLQIMQKEIQNSLTFEEFSGIGILFINGKNSFQFSHKTFSEFLVAQYFIENIFDIHGSVDSDEAELRLELFFHLAQNFGGNQRIITDFMTSYLQMKPNNSKTFHRTISKLLRAKFKNFFIRMLDTNYPKVFEFLFEFFKPDHDLLVDLLHVNEDETFYTAIFNPNYFALFTNPEEIKGLAQNCLTGKELQKFLTGKNQKGKILLGINFYGLLNVTKSNDAYKTEHDALNDTSFWNLFPKINENLTVEEHKVLFVAALSPKIYLFYDKMFSTADFSEYEQLWKNYENFLTHIEMQDALGDALVLYFETYPNDKVGHEKFLNLLLEKADFFLSNSQIFEMFLTKNILHEAHWDDESFVILWNFLDDHTNKQERKTILLQDDADDKNFYFYITSNELKGSFSSYVYNYFYYNFEPFKIFHRALTIANGYTFDFTIEIYQEHFDTSEIQKIVLNSNEFFNYVIGKAEEEPFAEFILFLKKLFEGNEKLLKEYLDRKINPVFELFEDFRGHFRSKKNWFNNLKTFSDLREELEKFAYDVE